MSDGARERIGYYDVLRIVATFAVMILHIAAYHWSTTAVASYEWKMFNLYDSLVRWSVPIFVMISGALFLNSERTMNNIAKKNILRIVTAFIFWSVLYVVVGHVLFEPVSMKTAVFSVLGGPYHMWFLFMIIGLYLIVPILREVVRYRKVTRYFLMISLLFAFVFPQMIRIMGHAQGVLVQEVSTVVDAIVTDFNFHIGLGYVFYFVAGAYLSKVEIPKTVRKVLYLLGIIGVLVTMCFAAKWSLMSGKASAFWYGNNTVNVMLTSIALFVFARYNLNMKQMGPRFRFVIHKLSNYCFGAYLIHVLIINILAKEFGITTLSWNAAVSVPLVGVIVFVCSMAVSAFINQIPGLKKYIV